jgi:hypothetical protein
MKKRTSETVASSGFSVDIEIFLGTLKAIRLFLGLSLIYSPDTNHIIFDSIKEPNYIPGMS